MIAELCIDVINSFNSMKEQFLILEDKICNVDRELACWFQEPENFNFPVRYTQRQKAYALLAQLEYLDKQAPREILIGAGLFAASASTILAIEELNAAKASFKQAMLRLKEAKINSSHDILTNGFEKILPTRNKELAKNLNRLGLARVHLKQCYRKIPIFRQTPIKVSWTWANTRSIKRVSIIEAKQLLEKQKLDAGIERQIRLLQSLPPTEQLAIVQELAPHLRANILFPDSIGSRRQMVKGPIPIFYLNDDKESFPIISPPGIKKGKDKSRATRSDVKIDPEIFLPAIRAHRYINEKEIINQY